MSKKTLGRPIFVAKLLKKLALRLEWTKLRVRIFGKDWAEHRAILRKSIFGVAAAAVDVFRRGKFQWDQWVWLRFYEQFGCVMLNDLLFGKDFQAFSSISWKFRGKINSPGKTSQNLLCIHIFWIQQSNWSMHDTWPKRRIELCYDNSTELGLKTSLLIKKSIQIPLEDIL